MLEDRGEESLPENYGLSKNGYGNVVTASYQTIL